MRNFLWVGIRRRGEFIWSLRGGLQLCNETFLSKWLWNFHLEYGTLWQRIIVNKYCFRLSFVPFLFVQRITVKFWMEEWTQDYLQRLPWYCSFIGVFFVGVRKRILTICFRIVIWLVRGGTDFLRCLGLYCLEIESVFRVWGGAFEPSRSLHRKDPMIV